MAEREPVAAVNCVRQYADNQLQRGDAARVMEWAEVRRRLAETRFYWLATSRRDGRPHVRPVLAVWLAGLLYSTTNPTAVKGRNLTRDPRFTLTASSDGIDLIVEGSAAQVSDEATLQAVAEIYRAKYEWPVTVRDGAFDAPFGAPSAGGPPYNVYAFTPAVVYALGTNETWAPLSTRWKF